MNPVDRRSLFAAALSAASLQAAPAWLTRWFAPQDPATQAPSGQDPPSREQQLKAAAQRAHDEGKRLLVFVVPETDPTTGKGVAEMSARGQWLGAFVTHCGTPAVFDLAACVLACATTAEVQKVVATEPIAGEPLMLVVDAFRIGEENDAVPKVTPIEYQLPNLSPTAEDEHDHWQQRVAAGIDAIAAAVKKGLDRHGLNLATLAKDASERLDESDRAAFERWIQGGDPVADRLMVRMVAEVRRVAGTRPDAERRRLLELLEGAVAKEVVKRAIPGARWYVPGGCGSQPEEQTAEEKKARPMLACGMAMMPPLCERFLNLYVGK